MMRITIDPAVVSQNFSEFRDNPSFRESAQLFQQGLPIVEMLQAFAMDRNVLAAFAGFDAIYPNGLLERGVLEKVILCISARNACQFCVNAHLDITRNLAITSSGASDPTAPEHSPRERLAIEYAAAMHADSNRVPPELINRLHGEFTDPEIVELTWMVGFINMLNMFNNALEVRYRGEFANVQPC